jgi:cytochrome c-type biogenesis protein CcmH/NrfG
MKKLEKRLKKDPNDVATLKELGNLHVMENNFEKAKEHYEKVVELDPANIGADLTLKFILSRLKEIKKNQIL